MPTAQELRRRAGLVDDQFVTAEQPYNVSAAEDDFLLQQGIQRSIYDRPAYELARYSPTTLNPQDQPSSVVPTTPLELTTRTSLRALPDEDPPGLLGRGLRALGGIGRELLRSVDVTEEGISGRERLWRAANIGLFFLPFGLGSRALGAAASRLFPAAGAALSTARGRILLTGVAEAGLSAGVESVREVEEGRNITAAAVAGGLLGVGGQALIQRATRSARRRASREALRELQDAQRLGEPDSPLLTREWAILTPQDPLSAQRAIAEGIDSPSARLGAQQILAFRKMLEDEGFLTQGVKLSTGQDALLVPNLPRRDAVRIAQQLGQRKIHTRDGLIDLDLDVMFPNDGRLPIGAETRAETDSFFELRVGGETVDNTVRISPVYNMQEPVTYGRNMNRVDLGDVVLDDSIYEVGNFERFAALDVRDVLSTLYARTVNATYGASVFDDVVRPGQRARAAGGRAGAAEIAEGGVVTDGLQKLLQLNQAKWSGFTETAMRTGLRSWDNVGEAAEGFNKALFDTLAEHVPSNEMEDFTKYGFLRMWQSLEAEGLQIPPSLRGAIGERLAQFGPEVEHWDTALREITRHQNTFMRETLLKQGIITQEQYASITSRAIHAPLTRRTKGMPRTVEELDTWLFEATDPVGRVKGVDVEATDRWVPWPEEVIRREGMYARMAGQQEVYNRLGELVSETPEALRHFAVPTEAPRGVRTAEIAPGVAVKQSLHSAEDGIYFRSMMPTEGGERVEQWFRLADTQEGKLMADALEFMGPTNASAVVKAAGLFGSLQRAGVTLGFDFMGKNVGRDIFFAFANAGIRPWAFLQGASTMLGSYLGRQVSTEWVDRFVASGGARAALVSMDRNYFSKLIREVQQGGVRNVAATLNPIEALRALSESLENSTRLGAFRQRYNDLISEAAKRGQDVDPSTVLNEAAIFAREGSVDFQMHGSSPLVANLRIMSAFWGAAVQGTDQIVKSVARDPVGTGTRMLAGITLPSVALYLYNRQDPEYKQLPEYERDLFWHVKRPAGMLGDDADDPSDDRWIRIPKPFEPGVVAGSFVERFLQFMDEEDPALLDEAASALSARMAEGYVPTPTVLQPLLENLANQSSMSGAPIVPAQLQDVDPSEHYGSEFGKAFARMLNADAQDATERISPLQVDNVVRSWTGGVGTLVSDLGDLTVRAYRRHKGEATPTTPAQEFIDYMPFIRGFTSAFPSGSSTVRDAYNYAERMRVAQRTGRYLESSLRADDFVDYTTQNGVMQGLNRLTEKLTTDLADLRDARMAVLNSKNMRPQEKRRTLHAIDQAMLKYAGGVNKAIRQLGIRAQDPVNPVSAVLRQALGEESRR